LNSNLIQTDLFFEDQKTQTQTQTIDISH